MLLLINTLIVISQKSVSEKVDASEVTKSQDTDVISTCYDLPLSKELIQIKQRKKVMKHFAVFENHLFSPVYYCTYVHIA